MLVHKIQIRQFYGIPFTFFSSLCNFCQPLDMLSVVSCIEVLYFGYYFKIFSPLIDNLKIQNY
jgi:hypothetical protein